MKYRNTKINLSHVMKDYGKRSPKNSSLLLKCKHMSSKLTLCADPATAPSLTPTYMVVMLKQCITLYYIVITNKLLCNKKYYIIVLIK